MSLNLTGYKERVEKAVQSFWATRHASGVRSGKTLDEFVCLLKWVVRSNGLPDAIVVHGQSAQVPGFFRPTKTWDLLILNGTILVAAIELKSIADSFGKNANNRIEEALGSGLDLKEAFAEDAFEGLTSAFTGYMLVVEECKQTTTNVKIQMKNFRAMTEFMAKPEERDERYVRLANGSFPVIDGVSYLKRFDILCKHLMKKKLYSAACVISAHREPGDGVVFDEVTPETSVKVFLAALAGHAQFIAATKLSNE
ncbi:PaeR7I family type II restriction endonuclease [Pseudomonas siliginis]|uniref:PaeR7I family type II restriction endonuclease n=1 Tax=Pseudomonas siliginis TaxID=2842346 RepID=UPI0020938255|nr:PaeR7I family type II restriction endonuclease [Pseudomonas siliginis]UST92730.1 PaeR7I family type II restriction endonuclease [Pseudomonas siliginis]